MNNEKRDLNTNIWQEIWNINSINYATNQDCQNGSKQKQISCHLQKPHLKYKDMQSLKENTWKEIYYSALTNKEKKCAILAVIIMKWNKANF